MFDDPFRCREDRTYPLAQSSGGAAGNVQLHNSLRRINGLRKKTDQQQERDEGDDAVFWELHGYAPIGGITKAKTAIVWFDYPTNNG